VAATAPVARGLRRRRAWRRRLTPFTVLSALVALLVAALAIYPLGTVLVRIFFTDGQLDLSGLRRTFDQPDLGTLVKNTLIVVIGSSAIALVLGGVLAWVNERTDARMGVVTAALPLIPFLLPPIAGSTAWVLLMSKKTWDGLSHEEQKIVQDAAREATLYERRTIRAFSDTALAELKKAGMQITELPPAEQAKMRSKLQPVLAKFSKEFGEDTTAELNGELAKVRGSATAKK